MKGDLSTKISNPNTSLKENPDLDQKNLVGVRENTTKAHIMTMEPPEIPTNYLQLNKYDKNNKIYLR